MVLTLMIPVRRIYGLDDLLTPKHVDNMAKIILVTGSMVGFAYAMEFFIAWYSGNQYESDAFLYNRLMPPFLAGKDPHTGLPGRYAPYWWAYWSMIFCKSS